MKNMSIGLVIVRFSGEDIENKIVGRITPQSASVIRILENIDEIKEDN